MPESPVKPYRQKFKELRQEFDSQGYRDTYQTIVDYVAPMRGRNLKSQIDSTETNDGMLKFQNIFNGSSSNAVRTFAAGMQGGLASPSRPWFMMRHPDTELNQFAPVKEWLHIVREEMLTEFARTNFYSASPSMIGEMGLFGTGAMFMPTSNQDRRISYRPYTVGEYHLMLDHNYRPIGLYRSFDMTARQIVQQWGKENVSQAVKSALEAAGEKKFRIIHCVQPNRFLDKSKLDFRGMEFESVYFEHTAPEDDKFLAREGFRVLPFVAPRFDVVGVDTYGIGPGHEAIGDVRMLQKIEEKKLKALDKEVDPPMTGPTALKKEKTTTVSGGITYVDVSQGQSGFQPAFQVRSNLQGAAVEIDRVERRIERFFYNDLFLSIISQQKTMTATEVAQRHDEKLVMLGPTIERFQSEALDPIVDRMFDNVVNGGRVPPPPPEIAGQKLEVDYISLLAQAQKIVGIQSIERTFGFVSQIAQVYPEARKKFNPNEAIDTFAEAHGIPPKVIRSDEEVAEMEAEEAAAAAAVAQQEQQLQMVDNVSKLANIKTDDNNVISDLTGGVSDAG